MKDEVTQTAPPSQDTTNDLREIARPPHVPPMGTLPEFLANGLALQFDPPSVAPDSKGTASWDIDWIPEILVLVPGGVFADRSTEQFLPTYGGRAKWTVCRPEQIPCAECYDLTVIVCAGREELDAVHDLTPELQRRRDTCVFLVPEALVNAVECMEVGVLVATAGPDAWAGLPLLAHTLVAPSVLDGLVCIDWAEVLTVLDSASHAILLAGAGATPIEAMDRLRDALPPEPSSDFLGSFGTLLSSPRATMRDYNRFRDLVVPHTREDGPLALSLPIHVGTGALASILAVTQRKARAQLRS